MFNEDSALGTTEPVVENAKFEKEPIVDVSNATLAWEAIDSTEKREEIHEEISGYIEKLNNKSQGGSEDLQAMQEFLQGLTEQEWQGYLNQASARAEAFTDQVLAISLEKGQITQGQADADKAHYKEVTELAYKLATKQGTLNREETLRTVLAARLHDGAKLAYRPGANAMQTLLLHEIGSAKAIMDCIDSIIANSPKEYSKLIAATAAAHGRGEFPALLAWKLGLEYPDFILAINDMPAVIVHLSDVLQGIFGMSGDPQHPIVGESWWKYANAHAKSLKPFSIAKTMESSFMTAVKNAAEVMLTINELPHKDLTRPFRQELNQQVGLAEAFNTFMAANYHNELYTEYEGEEVNQARIIYHAALTKFRSLLPQDLDKLAQNGATRFNISTFPQLLEIWKAELNGQIQGMDDISMKVDLKVKGANHAAHLLNNIQKIQPSLSQSSESVYFY